MVIRNLNWNDIRPINNSLNEGFEELVCQLARIEKIDSAVKFIRKGKPDAGIECFWTLEFCHEEYSFSWPALSPRILIASNILSAMLLSLTSLTNCRLMSL